MRHVLAILCIGAVLPLSAQAAGSDTQVTGSLKATYSVPGTPAAGIEYEIDFTCTGEPTCTGTYQLVLTLPGVCNNPVVMANKIVVSGLDLSKPGAISGSLDMTDTTTNFTIDQQGNCAFVGGGAATDLLFPYTGTWDGVSTGTMTISVPADPQPPLVFQGGFKADRSPAPPVFPMSVNTTIRDGIANSTANIQYRPQDVGQPGSVFVFAMAPIDRVLNPVKSGGLKWMIQRSEKDTPVECVLAQLSASGQLTGVSPSTMIAFVTGVLSSQGQAVTILNGVPVVNIGGATFFVGYGSNGASMINNGVNRSAVTIPGAKVCQPQAPQTGWWWNPAEDGRGFSIEKHGNNFFFASFLYDVSGRSTWYVSTGPGSLEGSLYVGDLLSATGGQTLGGDYPGFPTLSTVGKMTLAFNSATNGTLIWPGGTVPIQRLPFVPNGLALQPLPNQPESGWWWNPQEAGRGFFLEWQGNALDVAGYMYDDQGNPVWYLTVANMQGADNRGFTSSWWSFANGETLTGPWKPNTRVNSNVASVTIQFTGTDTAIMTLPNGHTTNLTRQRF